MEKLSRDEMYLLGLKLEPKSLLTFCQTDKFFYEKVCKNDNFWREKLKKDYPLLEKFNYKDDIPKISWKNFYMKMIYYISKLEEDFEVPYFSLKDFSPEDLYLTKDSTFFYVRVMIYAAGVGNIDLIEKMIKKGVREYEFAIGAASGEGQLETVKYLIGKGAQPNIAARIAGNNGHLDIIKYLIEKGYRIEINLVMGNAARKGYKNIVEYLIEQGANDFELSLLYATTGGQLDMVKYMVKKGARDFNDALLEASIQGHLDIVKYLIELGEIYDLKKALKLASGNGNIDIVKYLIEKGVKPSNEAIEEAEEEGFTEVADYLRSLYF